tara:strand:+ start:624 stop:776 length:153 start_codon:yes stop_codon:yes gene_type:complete
MARKKYEVGNRMTLSKYRKIIYSPEVQKMNNPDYVSLTKFLRDLIPRGKK